MGWQDFERERKWKLSQAKKVALRVNRSKLDVVARENRRLKVGELSCLNSLRDCGHVEECAAFGRGLM